MGTAVVTINYNSQADTARCMASLCQVTPAPELVIVDNGSRQADIENHLPDYPGVHIIKSPTNLGFGRGNNLGVRWLLRQSDCDSILLLNNDTTIEPDAIRFLEESLASSPDTGIAAPRIVHMADPGKLWFGGGEVHWFRGGGKVPGVPGPADSPIALSARQIRFASGCAMLIRRQVFEQVGGFDPRFFMYEEDLEFCLRVQEAGWKIRYEPQALVHHKLHGSQEQHDGVSLPAGHPKNPHLPFFMNNMTMNRLLNMGMHAHGRDRLKFLLGFPLYCLYDSLRFARAGRHDAVAALFRGAAAYFKLRRTPFHNELVSTDDCPVK